MAYQWCYPPKPKEDDKIDMGKIKFGQDRWNSWDTAELLDKIDLSGLQD